MKAVDFQNLDPAQIGSWPIVVRAAIMIGIVVALLAAGFYLDTRNQITQLEKQQRKETVLRQTFEVKQSKAANLEPLKELLAEMKQSLGEQLRLLPNKTEIESLLVDISQAGLMSGLEFELFKPEKEQPAEFYAIQPVNIKVTGSYHDFGEFISAVAALPRIVTQHDITIEPRDVSTNEESTLVMTSIAKTYRYMDEEEIAARAAEDQKNGKKKRQ